MKAMYNKKEKPRNPAMAPCAMMMVNCSCETASAVLKSQGPENWSRGRPAMVPWLAAGLCNANTVNPRCTEIGSAEGNKRVTFFE